MPRHLIIIFSIICWGCPLAVWSNGFDITNQGATATGKGMAFGAQADDPSAIYYNPAGIAQLRTPQVLVGASVIVPQISYRPESGSGGNSADQNNQTFVLPHLYATVPLQNNLTAGFGLYSPYGLAMDWPSNWDGRFQVTYVSVENVELSTALAWQPVDWLMIAASLRGSSITVEQRRQLNLAPLFGPGTPEGSVTIMGDDRSLGWGASALIALSEQIKLGVSFKSGSHFDINDGDADFATPGLEAFFPDGKASTEIDLPPSMRAGIMVRPQSHWNLEFDVVWTGWSTIDTLDIEFANGMPTSSTDFSWEDSMTFHFGTEYRFSSPWVIRGGFIYDQSPIPDRTLSPILPDGNRQFLSVGAGYGTAAWAVDVAYGLVRLDRRKNNEIGAELSSAGIDARANGDYDTRAHTAILSFRYQY